MPADTSPPSPTTVYLVRHGATDANERIPYILQGNAIDLPLNANGRRQAADLAAFFRERPLDAVLCSRMLRARQTAGDIAAARGLTVRECDNLHECDVGQWEGLDWETIRARFPVDCENFLADPAAHPMTGGESYADVLERVLPRWSEIVAEYAGKHVAIVAHNVVNRVLLTRLMGLETRYAPLIRQRNGCVNLVEIDAERPQVVTINGVFHLQTPTARAW
jgi:broad specificity phosphatase PhoE